MSASEILRRERERKARKREQRQVRRILRLREVEMRTGRKKSAIYSGIAAGTFPAPVPLGERAVGWVDDEIEVWIDQRIAARDAKRAEAASPRTAEAAEPNTPSPSTLPNKRRDDSREARNFASRPNKESAPVDRPRYSEIAD